MKSFEYQGKSGKTVRIEVTYMKEIVEVKTWFDCDERINKEVQVTSELKMFVDGNLAGTSEFPCVSPASQCGMDLPIGITHFMKLNNGKVTIGLEPQIAEEIERIIKEAKEDGKTEEVKAIEVEELVIEKENAASVIEKASNQEDIPSYEIARQRERNYNNLHNEGGEGYVLHTIDIEEYNKALETLAK